VGGHTLIGLERSSSTIEPADYLRLHSRIFDSVEVNSTFHRVLGAEKTFEGDIDDY
jgi:uncharacterized protein YecE (DUF72 family)